MWKNSTNYIMKTTIEMIGDSRDNIGGDRGDS